MAITAWTGISPPTPPHAAGSALPAPHRQRCVPAPAPPPCPPPPPPQGPASVVTDAPLPGPAPVPHSRPSVSSDPPSHLRPPPRRLPPLPPRPAAGLPIRPATLPVDTCLHNPPPAPASSPAPAAAQPTRPCPALLSLSRFCYCAALRLPPSADAPQARPLPYTPPCRTPRSVSHLLEHESVEGAASRSPVEPQHYRVFGGVALCGPAEGIQRTGLGQGVSRSGVAIAVKQAGC